MVHDEAPTVGDSPTEPSEEPAGPSGAPGIEGFVMPTHVEPEPGDAGLLTCEPCMRHANDDRERLEALADAVGVDLDEELPGYLRTYHDAGHRDPSGPAPEPEALR